MDCLVKRDNIKIIQRVSTWQEAIKESAQLLVNGGYIEPRYIDAIFESTKKNGPYYVLAPEIAMPHANPKDGVIEEQISLLVLRESIRFSEDGYDVRLIFTLAAKDNESHLDALRKLAAIFSDEERINDIIHAETVSEIETLLHN